MAGNLIHHVLKERHARIEAGLAGAIEIDLDSDLCFQGISFYPSLAFGHGDSKVISRHMPEKCLRALYLL